MSSILHATAAEPENLKYFSALSCTHGSWYSNDTIQCTKEKPACTPCLQLFLECNYSRKASRTPLTRNNLTAAEDRVRDLETAIRALFPGVDIETVVSSTIRSSGNVAVKAGDALAPGNKLTLSSREANHEPETTSESLPQAADGFDWTEGAVSLNELADGMAALSVNPEGAGYLGMSRRAGKP
jgi:transcriptional regulatory protein GAL4